MLLVADACSRTTWSDSSATTTCNKHESTTRRASCSKTDARGASVTYSYDALNRVTQAVWSDQSIQYTYDQGPNALGRLSSVSDNSGQTSWTYDLQGRPVSRQQVMGGISLGSSVSYDNAGRPSIVSYPSGHYLQLGYANGKVTSITLDGSTPILTDVLYEPFGPVRGWTWGNSTLAAHGRDLDGKVEYIDSAGLRTYNYDDAFRITGITDVVDPSLSQSYSYDLLDRLTGTNGSSLNQSWTYDPNGNRLTEGGSNPSTYSIAANSNRLTSVTGALTRSYTYDAAGNTLSDGSTNFTYDQAGRMVSATKSGITATYALNALGQRVRKTVAGVSTYFFYDESGRLMGEYDSTGAMVQEIVWLGDTPVASIRPGAGGSGVGVFYIHTDHLGAPTKLTRPNDNAIVWRWDRDPFGNGAPDEDPDGNSQVVQFNLRFPGQYFDAETGLNYNYFRDYDPSTGRYVESDPIGLDGGINTYAYVEGNPVNQVDTLGLLGRAPGYYAKKPGYYAKNKASPSTKRLPDYVSISIPLRNPVIGLNITIDRYGEFYVGPAFGLGYPAFGAQVGYLLPPPPNQQLSESKCPPSRTELNNFLSGVGGSYGFILGRAFNLSNDNSQSRQALTVTTPGLGVGYSFNPFRIPGAEDSNTVGSCGCQSN